MTARMGCISTSEICLTQTRYEPGAGGEYIGWTNEPRRSAHAIVVVAERETKANSYSSVSFCKSSSVQAQMGCHNVLDCDEQ